MKESKTTDNPRMSYTFTAHGHPNIRATHVKTIEFTKDDSITERGDCIVGVSATFEFSALKIFLEMQVKKIKCLISLTDRQTSENRTFDCKFVLNHSFSNQHELVLRKSFFNSDRTFGFNLNKAASRIPREMVKKLQNADTVIKVEFIEGWY